MATLSPVEHIITYKGSRTPRTRRFGIPVAFLGSMINDPEWPIERICEQYRLNPSEVYAAWSYYLDHKEEINKSIEENEKRIQAVGNAILVED